jgi:hypothetical protein
MRGSVESEWIGIEFENYFECYADDYDCYNDCSDGSGGVREGCESETVDGNGWFVGDGIVVENGE